MSTLIRTFAMTAVTLVASAAACQGPGDGFGGEGMLGSTVSGSEAGAGCAGLAPPATPAGCSSCSASSSDCQPNGCYGGWYCDTATDRCQAPPTICPDAGGNRWRRRGGQRGRERARDRRPRGERTGPSGVGPGGGRVSQLLFAVVGDTRPPNIGDTSGYPVAIATKIFQDLDGLDPRPAFGVSSGDYMFVQPGSGQAAPQLDLYLQARANFSNVMFPAMGNH